MYMQLDLCVYSSCLLGLSLGFQDVSPDWCENMWGGFWFETLLIFIFKIRLGMFFLQFSASHAQLLPLPHSVWLWMCAECPPQSILWNQGCSFLFWRNCCNFLLYLIFSLWNKFRGVAFLILSSGLLEGTFRKWNGKVSFLWYFLGEFRNSTTNQNRLRQADHVSHYGLRIGRYRSLKGKFLKIAGFPLLWSTPVFPHHWPSTDCPERFTVICKLGVPLLPPFSKPVKMVHKSGFSTTARERPTLLQQFCNFSVKFLRNFEIPCAPGDCFPLTS